MPTGMPKVSRADQTAVINVPSWLFQLPPVPNLQSRQKEAPKLRDVLSALQTQLLACPWCHWVSAASKAFGFINLISFTLVPSNLKMQNSITPSLALQARFAFTDQISSTFILISDLIWSQTLSSSSNWIKPQHTKGINPFNFLF